MALSCLLIFLLLSQRCICQYSNVEITFGIEYDNKRCGINLTAPQELNLTLSSGSTALDIMEGAANFSRNYGFDVTFLGDMGYVIDSVGGTPSSGGCAWHLFVVMPNKTRTLSQLHYFLPKNVTTAVLHYTTEQALAEPLTLKPRIGSENLTVYYIIEYEDECNNGIELASQPLKVVISKGDTALHVLENAVHSLNDSQYRFTSTYYGTLGYHVHTINGTSDIYSEDTVCYWSLLIKEPTSSDRVPSQVGVTHYVIPGENYTIIMRYTDEFYLVDDDPSFGMQNTPLDLGVVLLLTVICSIIF